MTGRDMHPFTRGFVADAKRRLAELDRHLAQPQVPVVARALAKVKANLITALRHRGVEYAEAPSMPPEGTAVSTAPVAPDDSEGGNVD